MATASKIFPIKGEQHWILQKTCDQQPSRDEYDKNYGISLKKQTFDWNQSGNWKWWRTKRNK